MVGYISGRVLEYSEGRAIVAVGQPGNAVGYVVRVPEIYAIVVGEPIELHVYTHVREEAFDLFGFASAAEKDLFLTVLDVNGIGPKSALNILSGASAADILQAIVRGDKVFLSAIPGIGKKTAERIVLELADKIRKKMDAGIYAALKPLSGLNAPAGATAHSGGPLLGDALSALVGLGYRAPDAERVLLEIIELKEPAKVDDLIRLALRQLS